MSNTQLLVGIALTLVVGFALGVVYSRKKSASFSGSSASPWPQQRYYESLTQLLGDDPDVAIDTFLSTLEINTDTLEIHLALGSLSRKRGEVSRAIRIHQNLLSHSGLSSKQLHQVQLELAVDYMKAGLLDRAESLFKSLIDLRNIEKSVRQQALENILEVYQELNEWLQAIDIADRLTTRKFVGAADSWREKQAHFSCEIAEAAIEEGDWISARRWLRSAHRYDKACIRVNILLAKLEASQHEYPLAIAALRKVLPQSSAEVDGGGKFVAELLPPLVECYQKLDDPKGLYRELCKLYEHGPQLVVLHYLAKAKEAVEGEGAVVDLLLNELPNYLKTEAVGDLLLLLKEEKRSGGLQISTSLNVILSQLASMPGEYLCENCGFSGSEIHWLCPSCKSWGSISSR